MEALLALRGADRAYRGRVPIEGRAPRACTRDVRVDPPEQRDIEGMGGRFWYESRH